MRRTTVSRMVPVPPDAQMTGRLVFEIEDPVTGHTRCEVEFDEPTPALLLRHLVSDTAGELVYVVTRDESEPEPEPERPRRAGYYAEAIAAGMVVEIDDGGRQP